MSRYSRYPFQPGAPAAAHATHQTVATTHLPPHHHHQHHHHQLRNPWVSGVECRESGSTNSSSASSRRGGGPWLHPLDLNHQPPPRHHHLYEQPLDVLGPSSALLPPGAHGHGLVSAPPPPPPQAPHAHAPAASAAAPGSSRTASDRDRPTTPASSPGSAGLHGGSAALDGCGGHCVAFENFCYYCLQVVFVAGVLCGVSLTIAGSVLRQGPGTVAHRGRDLVVLVYIGCLLALVCAVLLAVQCCVRRNVKRRKRALRERRARTQTHAAAAATAAAAPPPFTDLSGDAVPLQELPPAPAPAPAAISQYQPLLVRLVQQQQQQQQQQHHMQTLLPERHHQYRYRHSNMTVDPPLDTSRSGTPWWRRRSDFKQTVIESRH